MDSTLHSLLLLEAERQHQSQESDPVEREPLVRTARPFPGTPERSLRPSCPTVRRGGHLAPPSPRASPPATAVALIWLFSGGLRAQAWSPVQSGDWGRA